MKLLRIAICSLLMFSAYGAASVYPDTATSVVLQNVSGSTINFGKAGPVLNGGTVEVFLPELRTITTSTNFVVVKINGTSGVNWSAGTPEGSVTGWPGWVCWDQTGNNLYAKDTGEGTTTGWVLVSGGGGGSLTSVDQLTYNSVALSSATPSLSWNTNKYIQRITADTTYTFANVPTDTNTVKVLDYWVIGDGTHVLTNSANTISFEPTFPGVVPTGTNLLRFTWTGGLIHCDVTWMENAVDGLVLQINGVRTNAVLGTNLSRSGNTINAAGGSAPTGTMVSSGSFAAGAAPVASDTTGTNFQSSKVVLTAPATTATLTIANNKTATINNTLTLAGTDSTTVTFQGTDTYVGRATTDTLTNKRITQRVATLTDAATVTSDVDSFDGGKLTTLSQNTTIANPTGTPTDMQRYLFRIKSTTSRTLSFGPQFHGGVDLPLPTATSGSSLTDYLGFMWNATESRWDLVAKTFGY